MTEISHTVGYQAVYVITSQCFG